MGLTYINYRLFHFMHWLPLLLYCPHCCLNAIQSECLSQSHLVRVAVLRLICNVRHSVFLYLAVTLKTILHPAFQKEQIPLPWKCFDPTSCLPVQFIPHPAKPMSDPLLTRPRLFKRRIMPDKSLSSG